LWNYDLDSGRLFWDAHIRQQFGVKADDTITVDDFYAMVHPDDRDGIKAAFVRATEQHEMYDVEYRVGSLETPTWIRSLARAAYRPDGSPYRMDGMTLDVTARKRIEDDHAVLLQREQAARSETESALKTRDDFLAAASHELRNPLNALMLQLGGLRRAAQRDPSSLATPAMTGRLDRSEEQITRLVRLVDTLLDVSRIKSGRLDIEYAEVDLVAVAKSVVQQLDPIGDGVSVRLQAPPTLVGRWDPLRVEQVLTNLVSNALKYGDGKPVDVDISRDGDCAHIAVTDRGIGIPSDMVQRLFARFERLTPDHRRGGFGLGLWITRQIVNAFGGTIEVRSELGKGSTFSVALPRQPRACDAQAKDHASS
jgi:signal transduction histidine kinase